jgi:hypothetical protein
MSPTARVVQVTEADVIHTWWSNSRKGYTKSQKSSQRFEK